MINLAIGKLDIVLTGIKKEQIPVNTLLFQSDKQEPDLTYTFHFENKLASSIFYPIIYQTSDIIIFRKPNNCEARLLYLPTRVHRSIGWIFKFNCPCIYNIDWYD